VIFVGDAVRHDFSADRLSDIGKTYKTVSSSLHTPASFGSILSGRDVPAHGIFGFENKLPDHIDSICDMDDINVAFSNKTGTMHEDLHRMFGLKTRSTLPDLEEPFIWIVRDPGGHAPYDGY
jgi:hypothetical protein